MENLCSSSSWSAMGDVDDPRLRMLSRPSRPKTVNARLTGMATEDLGSSFFETAKQTKSKPSAKGRQRTNKTQTSDCSDELDVLSPSSCASSRGGSVAGENQRDRKDVSMDGQGLHHDSRPSIQGKSVVLKRLKFNKIRPTQDDDTQACDVPLSQPSVLQHGNADSSISGETTHLPKPLQTDTRREYSPVRTTRNRSSSRGQCTAHRDGPPSELTRPKPRPLRRKAPAVQLVPKAFPVVSPPRSPARRIIISGTPTRSFSDFSPIRVPDNDDPGKSSPVKKLKAQVFPSLSPRASSFEPLGSQEHMTRKKSSGKRSVSEKTVMTKARSAANKKESAESSIRKRGFKSASSRQAIVSSDNADDNDGQGQVDAFQVQAFPLSAQVLNTPSSSIDKASRKNNAPKAQPFPMSTQAFDSIGPSPLSDKSTRKKSKPAAQPFPMSTQVLDSIGSSPIIAERSDLKRFSSEICDDPDPKRLKETGAEEEDVEKEIDPGTLCPYCDASLPLQPTSQLNHLLASAFEKSHPEPRPGNRLGRTAPFTVYIAVCQRHRFESQMLPEAERKGWPKTIDWSELGKRVRKMKGTLRAIIEDNGDVSSNSFGTEETRNRARCVFWKEALDEVRSKGTRAVAGVRGQFASFEKIQPGYYGETGSVIIHQTLYDLFPPALIDPGLVSPLTASEFIQRILVPETGVRLIMQDMNLDESQMRDAVKILRDSANYGVAMFPVDEGEENEGRLDNVELDAADMIIMKRAMKRRKQLDADERAEEEEYQRQIQEAKEADKQERAKRARKEKELELYVKVESLPQASKPRPKPRPLGKGTTSTTSLNDVEIALSVGGTDVEDVPNLSQGRPKPRLFPTRSGTSSQLSSDKNAEAIAHRSESPKPRRLISRNAIDLQNIDTDETPRKSIIPARTSFVDIDLCSSSESSVVNDRDWDTGRMKRDQNQKKCRGKTKTSSDDGDVLKVLSLSPVRTPNATRSRYLSNSEDDTPKPRVTPKTLTSEMDDVWKIPPLQRARERSHRSSAPSRQREESHAWLLSDNSHSSIESIKC